MQVALEGFQTLFPSLPSIILPQGSLGACDHPWNKTCPDLPQCHPGPMQASALCPFRGLAVLGSQCVQEA